MPPGLMVFGADGFNFGDSLIVILNILCKSVPHGFQNGTYLEEPGYVIQSGNACFLKSGNGVFTTVYDILL
ncbi:hypothetical protein D3C74_267340 [compost metagenome]